MEHFGCFAHLNRWISVVITNLANWSELTGMTLTQIFTDLIKIEGFLAQIYTRLTGILVGNW